MERNAYSPPAAPISDIKPAEASDRPREVSIATLLISASMALGVVTSIILAPTVAPTGPTLLGQLFVQAFTLILIGWLTYKIWKGRNWARITYAALGGIGWAFYIPILTRMFKLSAVAGSINLLQSVLQLIALYLVFSDPGRKWFAAKPDAT